MQKYSQKYSQNVEFVSVPIISQIVKTTSNDQQTNATKKEGNVISEDKAKMISAHVASPMCIKMKFFF